MFSSHSRVERPVVDGADAITIGDSDFDVAIDAPVSAPGVADNPVFKARVRVCVITDN